MKHKCGVKIKQKQAKDVNARNDGRKKQQIGHIKGSIRMELRVKQVDQRIVKLDVIKGSYFNSHSILFISQQFFVVISPSSSIQVTQCTE